MDSTLFVNDASGELVPIYGSDPLTGPWQALAFVPRPLPEAAPRLSPSTYLVVANARAALAALDNTARRLPDPRLLRNPSLRLEAQSTSALEGTYEPVERVLAADADGVVDARLREVLNYVSMAEMAFESLAQGRQLTVVLLSELQARLVGGTALERPASGRIRTTQVVVGRSSPSIGANAIEAARFVPPPAGIDLESRVRDLLGWMSTDHRAEIDPVVAAAMAHYQFETLHPFHDGNGRIGRLLIVLHFLISRTIQEPTLTVSPWFEQRRTEYFNRLFAVSSAGDWDSWIRFFASGIEESAASTHRQMLQLLDVQEGLHSMVNESRLRARTAHQLVDLAVGRLSFTVQQAAEVLEVSVVRANSLVNDLVELDVLQPWGARSYARRFYSRQVFLVLQGLPSNW